MDCLPRIVALALALPAFGLPGPLGEARAQSFTGGTEELGQEGTLSANQRLIAGGVSLTISTTQTFVFRFAADFDAYAAVISASSVNNFINGGSFTRYGTAFDGNYGTQSITLGPGSYAVAVRNLTAGSNSFKVELDRPAGFTNAGTGSTVINGTDYVSKNGGRYWHPFTITSGYYYYMDGANSGLNTYIIPASALSNFQNGSTFSHYPDYAGTGNLDMPGGYVITLAPGSYYLCFHNPSSVNRAVTYTMQRFAANSPSGGGTGGTGGTGGYTPTIYPRFSSGGASWRTQGSRVRLTIPSIVNRSSTRTTGTLRVYLMASRSSATVRRGQGSVVGMVSYGRLSPNTYYRARSTSTRRYRAPSGRLRTAMVLAEYTGRYTVRDVRVFPRVVTLR